jgi:ATP-dependent Clp protease ATP-binding subunit ClpB
MPSFSHATDTHAIVIGLAYSVLLFDEMEKAHPDVFNVMLQILDDGRVTDSRGNVVNFKNTVIIFTSNVGSQDILDLGGSSDPADQEIMKDRVRAAMKDKFRPEFLNRIDEEVIFNSLSKENLRGIVKIEVSKLEGRLKERDISLELTDAALDFLSDKGFDPVYGARPLKRAIQRDLETTVAQGILRGDYKDGDTILADAENGEIVVKQIPSKVVDVKVEELQEFE